MSFIGGLLRDHYYQPGCLNPGNPTKLCKDKNSQTKPENVTRSFANGSVDKSILLSQ